MYDTNRQVFTLADASPDIRARFIRRTYAHLALAVAAFVGLEYVLLQLPISYELTEKVLGMPFGWLMVLGGFMAVGWLSTGLASKTDSKAAQYAGLALYVVAEAIIFVPLLIIAIHYAGDGGTHLVEQAGIITGLLFAGLTATVFVTRKDFSFLKSFLTMGFFVAIGLIVAAVIFGINLGFWFSAGMIVLAAGAILYDTSNILHHYREDQYVGAALSLFASVALLFWYVLQLLMSRD